MFPILQVFTVYCTFSFISCMLRVRTYHFVCGESNSSLNIEEQFEKTSDELKPKTMIQKQRIN